MSWRRKRGRFEREPEVMERAVEALERYGQLIEEERAFTREIMRRNEKVLKGLLQSDGERRSEATDHFAAVDARLRELTDESRAQQDGLFRVFDRLPPSDDPR